MIPDTISASDSIMPDLPTILPVSTGQSRVDFHVGDCLEVLRTLQSRSIQSCITSPPYFRLRNYGVTGQIGQEDTVEQYVVKLVSIFQEVRRVLRDDGTVWLNLGDTYFHSNQSGPQGRTGQRADRRYTADDAGRHRAEPGAQAKGLLLVPSRVAMALQADGWLLRSSIIWHKPNCMPESIKDRPTTAHEHIFLLAKRKRYFYRPDAAQEPSRSPSEMRNLRNVWSIPAQPSVHPHFAMMPLRLAERCVQAGSRSGDMVLDPFCGAGTTGLAAALTGRGACLIDINPAFVALARERISAALTKPRRHKMIAADGSPVIDISRTNDDAKRLPVTEASEPEIAAHDISSSDLRARIRVRRAVARYRDKVRDRGDRELTLWVHDTRSAEVQLEFQRQATIITTIGPEVMHDR